MMTCDYAVKADKGFNSVHERDLTRELPVCVGKKKHLAHHPGYR